MNKKLNCAHEKILQFLPALIASFIAVSDGMQYGWSAPVIPILKSGNSTITIKKIDEFWLETSFLMSGLIGLPISIYLTNTKGPKKAITVASVFALISWIMMTVATKVQHLYISRIIVGFSVNICDVSLPIYVTEVAGKHIRGFLASIDYFMMMIGVLIVYLVVPFCPFYFCGLIGIILIKIQLITMPFIPESPYFLLSRGRLNEAKLSLTQLRTNNNIDSELQEITSAVEVANNTGNFLNLIKTNRKAIIIITALVASQQCSGFNVLLMNLHSILHKTNSEIFTPELDGIIFSALMVFSTGVCSAYVDKIGRKILLIISGILTSVCLLVISIHFTLMYSDVKFNRFSWILYTAVMLYAVSFKLGLGVLPQILSSELFALSIKAKALAFAVFLELVFGTITLSFFHYVALYHRINIAFFVFSFIALSSVVFTIFFVPETKNKSLTDIQIMMQS